MRIYKKEDITCYDDMNKKIVGFLDLMDDNAVATYAAARIVELEARLAKLSDTSIFEIATIEHIKSETEGLSNQERINWFEERLNNLRAGAAKSLHAAPLSKEEIEKFTSEIYKANFKDYWFGTSEEAFHKGVEIGIWGINNEIKSGTII